MPINFVVDTQRALVLSTAWGEISAHELLQNERSLGQAAGFSPGMRQLGDFRAVTVPRVSWKDMRELAFHSPFAPSARRAFVVGSEEMYGLARMYQMAADRDDENMQVFRDLAQARRWLGIDGLEEPAAAPDPDAPFPHPRSARR